MDSVKAIGLGLFIIGLLALIVQPMFLMLEDPEVPLGISAGYWTMMLGMAVLLFVAARDRMKASAEEAGDEDMQRKY